MVLEDGDGVEPALASRLPPSVVTDGLGSPSSRSLSSSLPLPTPSEVAVAGADGGSAAPLASAAKRPSAESAASTSEEAGGNLVDRGDDRGRDDSTKDGSTNRLGEITNSRHGGSSSGSSSLYAIGAMSNAVPFRRPSVAKKGSECGEAAEA